MAVAFDATGTGALVTAASGSWTHVPAAGANVLAFVSCTGTSASGVTYAGTAMTNLGAISFNNLGATSSGEISLWRITGVASGSNTVIATIGTTAHLSANTVSYTGVLSAGTPATTFGTGATASQSATWAAGQMIVQGFGVGFSSSSPSGGTNRYNGSASACSVCISDATANTTFTVSTGTNVWGGIAVILTGATTPTDLFFPFLS